MDIASLIWALIVIGILCIVAYVVTAIVPAIPPVVRTIIWAIVGIMCLLVLGGAVTGHPVIH